MPPNWEQWKQVVENEIRRLGSEERAEKSRLTAVEYELSACVERQREWLGAPADDEEWGGGDPISENAPSQEKPLRNRDGPEPIPEVRVEPVVAPVEPSSDWGHAEAVRLMKPSMPEVHDVDAEFVMASATMGPRPVEGQARPQATVNLMAEIPAGPSAGTR